MFTQSILLLYLVIPIILHSQMFPRKCPPVAPPQARPLCQNEFQFRGGASRDQGPDQRESVLVEVRLHRRVQISLIIV